MQNEPHHTISAAGEYDLEVPLEPGADLVACSAHKFATGLTAGIIAEQFRRLSAHFPPAIHLKSHDFDQAPPLIDPSTASDEEMLEVTARIFRLLRDPRELPQFADQPLPPSEYLDSWPDPPPRPI